MISIKTTEKLTGVEIKGSYDDFKHLYDAISNVIGDEGCYKGYHDSQIFVLGLCYDIRHAYQGDRDTIISDFDEKQYSFKWYWTDIIYVYAVLKDFIEFSSGRNCYLLKEKVVELYRNEAMTDKLLDRLPDDIALVKYFRSLIENELQRVIGQKRFASLSRQASYKYILRSFSEYRIQIIPLYTIKYINRAPEKRRTYLATLTERILFYNEEYARYANEINRFAVENGISTSMVELAGTEYPETVEW